MRGSRKSVNFDYPHLKRTIQIWLQQKNDPWKLQQHMQLRALSTSLKTIASRSSPTLILYLLLKGLPFLFPPQAEHNTLSLSHQIKEQYRSWLMEQYNHNRNIFQLFVLYQVNLAALFVSEHFEEVEVDQLIKGQLCVVLYYCLLGITVGQSIFLTLAKRYAGRRRKSITSKISLSKGGCKSTKKSIFSIPAKSKKMLDSHSRKLVGTQRRIRFSKISLHNASALSKVRQDYEREQFQSELKENLKVDPLPQIPKKKMNINDYQRFLTETQPSTHDLFSNLSQQRLQKQRAKYIFSNQLSSSLKQAYNQQLDFELHSKRVKLNQTVHHFNREWVLQEETRELGMLATGIAVESVGGRKMQVGEWMELVGRLKKKVRNLNWQNTEQDKRHSFGLQ